MPIQLLDQERDRGGLLCDVDENPPFAVGFYAKHCKRALDAFLATACLILLSPVLGFLACCIKLTSRGPLLFRQVRVGKGGRPFQILKFRSMVVHSLPTDKMITITGDPRVTAMGKVLRRYKFDELPQLWNVIRGDMSLVGPRPELPVYVSGYTPDQRIVLYARPGITDPASLAYRHEEEILAEQSDAEQFYRTQILPDKLTRSRAYLQQITFRNDIHIILKTISSSFLPSGKIEIRRSL
jgi:lipopolysaccharide/colanic/teichoic acid biosynthesis glycosyltransferase